VTVAVLSDTTDGHEWMADDFVSIALVDVVEAGDVEEACLVFEVEEHDAPSALCGREAETDGVSDDKDGFSMVEVRCFGGGEPTTRSNPSTFERHEVVGYIHAEKATFGNGFFDYFEVWDVEGEGWVFELKW